MKGDTSVKLYDTIKGKYVRDIAFSGQIIALAMNDISTEIAVMVDDGYLMVTDVEGCKPVRSIKLPVVKRSSVFCNPLIVFMAQGAMIRVVTTQGLLLSIRYVEGQLVQMGRVIPIIE
eukprot:gnl/Chilomastix_caulleri/4403.p1 GENE.gnl/Chilomastix_caulleri/4403~~gnl/Chilomastix_caulleri/4403.p1  ORF type:complete len:118 (+),score=10.50 gnl/Chilomastix_caulleri/4403:77-430(+)